MWESPIEGNVHMENGQDSVVDIDFSIVQGQKRVHGWIADFGAW